MGGKFGNGQKIPRERACDIATEFISKLPQGDINAWEICGSYRRGKDMIGDIELLIYFSPYQLWQAGLTRIVGCAKNGNCKRSTTLHGAQIDLFVTDKINQLGALILHCTGSWETNRNMRFVATRKGYLLNQYGLWAPVNEDEFTDDAFHYRRRERKSDPWECFKQIDNGTEESIFELLELKYKKPEER